MYLKSFNIFCTLLIVSTIFLLSSKTLGQYGKENDSLYLKTYVSNTDPALNEIVTIKAICTAPRDLEDAIIYFDMYKENTFFGDPKPDEGIEVIKGERLWRGKMKAGETISKEISIRFTQKRIYLIAVDFKFFPAHKNLNKLTIFYPGGAFEEDERVTKMRSAIDWFREELTNPHSDPVPPDTSTTVYPEDIEALKRSENIDKKESKTQSRMNDKENIRKNDSLLIELRKEYETLKNQVKQKKRDRSIQKKRSLGINNIEDTVNPSDLQVTVIKNCSTQQLCFYFAGTSNVAPMTNWRVSPSYFGTFTQMGNNTVVFSAGNSTGGGTIYATYNGVERTWGYVNIIDHINIRGTVSYTKNDNTTDYPEGSYVRLYSGGSFIATDLVESNGYFEFLDVKKSNLTFKLVTQSDAASVVDSRNGGKVYEYSKSYENMAQYVTDFTYYVNANFQFRYTNNSEMNFCSAYNIIKYIDKGFDKAKQFSAGTTNPANPQVVSIDWNPQTNVTQTTNRITISSRAGDLDQWDPSVILHEYGHWSMQSYATMPPSSGVGSHYWSTVSNVQCAYSEGWATFFSDVVLGSSLYIDWGGLGTNYFDAETPTSNPKGNDVEGAICATLWDIYDSNNDVTNGTYDNNDNLSLGMTPIWNVFQNSLYNGSHHPYDFYEFATGWFNNHYYSIYNLAKAHGVTALMALSGPLSSNETWDVNVALGGDVTVQQGATLTIQKNVEVNLGKYSILFNGGSIVNNGTIKDLKAKLGANSVLKGLHSSIQTAANYANNGNEIVLVDGNFNENVSVSNKSSLSISGGSSNYTHFGRLTLTNCNNFYGINFGSKSVYVNNADYNIISNVGAQGTDQSTIGFYLYNSDATANNLYVDYSQAGVSCYDGTVANISSSGLYNSLRGLECYNGSNVSISNSFFCGTALDLKAYNFSTITANSCYFDGGTPSTSQSSSTITTSSNHSCSLAKENSSQQTGDNNYVVSSNEDKSEFEKINASYFDINKKLSDALKSKDAFSKESYCTEYENIIKGYKKFIETNLNSPLAQIAFNAAANSYRRIDDLRGKSDPDGMKKYLQEVIESKGYLALKPSAEKLMVNYYRLAKDFTGAIKTADNLIEKYKKDQDYVCGLLYAKGLMLVHDLNQPDKAVESFSTILQQYPENALAALAENELSIMGLDVKKPTTGKGEIAGNAFESNNYPNPFNPTTTIRFNLPQAGKVAIRIYDILGREIAELLNEMKPAGSHSVVWNGKDSFGREVSSGVYFYNIRYNDQSITKKMMLIR